jgi:hypothetical protein
MRDESGSKLRFDAFNLAAGVSTISSLIAAALILAFLRFKIEKAPGNR